MKRYTDIAGSINYYLFLAVVALLPFPQIFLRYACVLWFVAWVFEGRWLQRPKAWKENKTAIPFLLFGLWYGWKLLSGLWVADTTAWSSQIERYITFGVMIPVGLWGVNSRYNWLQAGKVLVIGCVCAAFFYPLLLTVLLHHREIIDATHWVAPWDYSSLEWLYFYQMNLSHVKYRLFLGSVELFGMIIAAGLWFRERRWLWAVMTTLLFGSILLSGSRQALMTFVVMALIALIFLLSKRLKWYYTASIVVATILLSGALLSLHPRFHTMDIRSEERVLIWKAASEHPTDYFWAGYGGGQDGVHLPACHSHNQHLQELRESGIFGLVLFLLAWLSIPLCAPKEQKRLAILFTALYACNMLTECMFSQYCSVALWSVGLIFILLQPDSTRQSDTAREQ